MRIVFCFLLSMGLLTAANGWAQVANAQAQTALDWIRNDSYQVQYQVPSDWRVQMDAQDSATVVTHTDPTGRILLVVAKLRDGARHYTPHEALDQLLTKFDVKGNKRYLTKYNGIEFVETTGTGRLAGHELRYDAMAAHHRGHVLLVYLYAPPEVFTTQDAMLTQMVHSISPYRPTKRYAERPAERKHTTTSGPAVSWK